MMPNNKSNYMRAEERRPRLDEQKKQEMLAICIRNKNAFESVRELLSVKQVRRWSEPMGLVWRSVVSFYKRFDDLPDRGQLHAELSNYITNNPDAIDDDETEIINEFIDYTWDDKHHGAKISTSRKHTRVALSTCSQLLEEMAAADFQQTMSADSGIVVDMPRLFEVTQAAVSQARSLVEAAVEVPFPVGWDTKEDSSLFSTGVSALDEFMAGGYRAKEVFVFMAPYGSCKTVLACAGASAQIQQCMQAETEGTARRNSKGKVMIPQVVLMFTENDLDEYRCRLMSNMAMVPWNRIAGMNSIEDLDDGDHPGATPETRYELSAFKQSIENNMPWFNEQQRVRAALTLANRYLVLLDCTSSSAVMKIGAGGMNDVANVVDAFYTKNRNTRYPYSFWFDHLSGLIDQVSMVVDDESKLRRILMSSPKVAMDRLCIKHKAPVGIMHQLAGQAQNKGATGKLHHSDAEGSKAVAKYATFAIVSGPTDENNMCKWEMTKHRRTPAMPYRIVEVRGQFNQLIDRAETHGIVPGQRVIMSHKDMHMIGAGQNGKQDDDDDGIQVQ